MTTDPQTPVGDLEGRELDAAVAEEVMGWKRVSDGIHGRMWLDGSGEPESLPHYSSEPMDADTWGVWKEVFSDGPYLILQGEGCFFVRKDVSEPYDPGFEQLARADTAPLAICRAALKAVRDE